MPAEPTLTWNLARDASELFAYRFMVNALLAGTIVAVMAGALGWFMVVRRDAFAGHTLSMMAFPGAAGAALLGIPAAWGYFGLCAAGALAIGGAVPSHPDTRGARSAAIGSFQALALAVGFLFVSLYGGVLGDLENRLFGTLVGVSGGQLTVLLGVALVALAALCAVARPLLFASVDPQVAHARGVPVRLLSVLYLLALGLAVAETAQITGVLLVFALLLAPPASAQALTARPLAGLALSVALGLAVVWLGLALAYFSPYPAGFFIATISFAVYALARLAARGRSRARDRSRGSSRPDHDRPTPAAQGVIA